MPNEVLVPMDEIPMAENLDDASIVGLDQNGNSVRFNIGDIAGNYKGIADTSTDPGTTGLGRFYLAPPGTYTFFLDAGGVPITIPSSVGPDQVVMGFISVNGAVSTATYKAISISVGAGYALQTDFDRIRQASESTTNISTVSTDNIVWQNARGDAEVAGTSTFTNANGIGIGMVQQTLAAVTFRKIKVPFFAGADSAITVRLYKGTTSTGNVNSLTLIKELTFGVGVFNQVSGTAPILDLGATYALAANDYFYAFIYATAGTNPSMRYFGVDAGSAPFRPRFLILGTGQKLAPWTSTYNFATGGNYQGAFDLLTTTITYTGALTDAVKNDIVATKGLLAKDASGQLLGVITPAVQWVHPRGATEMQGNSNFQNTGGNGVCVWRTMATNVVFNRAILPFYGTITSAVTIRIYKSSTFNAAPASSTLLKEVVLAAGAFNTSSTGNHTLILDTYYAINASETVYFFLYTTAGAIIHLKEWNADSGVSPLRDKTLYLATANVATPWTSIWQIGGAAHYQAAFELLAVDAYLASLIGGNAAAPTLPRINIPQKIYGVVGYETAIYHDSIILSKDKGLFSPENYTVEITGDVGLMDTRRFYVTPVTADIGSHDLTINVYNGAGVRIDGKTIQLVILAQTALGTTKNILGIGDSLMFEGTMTQTMRNNFVALGGTTPTFRGNHGTSPNNQEGIGGTTFNFWAGPGTNFYKFTISGVTTASVGSEYTNNGSAFRVEETNITGGAGYIKCSRKSGTNDPSTGPGTLTKSKWNGDATIAYSAWVLEPGNPLYNVSTSALDIANYRTNLGMGATKFNLVEIQLGINDVNGAQGTGDDKSETYLQNVVGYAKNIVDAFIADSAATKIIVQLPTICGNTNGGWATLYGAGNSKELFMVAMWRLREIILTTFDNGAYNANVFVGQKGVSLDRFWGYDLIDKQPGVRYGSFTEKDHINSVHPGTAGYQQLGDAIFVQALALLS